MLKNYFHNAFRNLWNNKTISFIKILGLSIGISAALVIFLIVHYEFSFDRFEDNNNNIYRVVMDLKFNGEEGHSAAVPAPLAEAVKNEIAGVEATVPVMKFQGDGNARVTITDAGSNKQTTYKKQPDVVFTNNEYLQLLGYKWIAGSAKAALTEPFSVVLNESRAKQYFPNSLPEDVVGKQIMYNDHLKTTVTGIVKDLDKQSDFRGTEFVSYSTISKTSLQDEFMMNVWNDWMAYSSLYVKLSKGQDHKQTEAQIANLLKKYNKEANKDNSNTMVFKLQPLSNVHFNQQYTGFGQRIARKPTLYGLLAVGGFLLVLGCINFINLTTAQASRRAKEIGVRKTFGGTRNQLVVQFLCETFFITVIATLASIVLTPLLLKIFADFIPQDLHFRFMDQPVIFLFLLALTVLVSFLAGIYPSLILSTYKPVSVMKNQVQGGSQSRNAWTRKSLTVGQFVIAQFFIIASFMVSKQINYSINQDLGYAKDGIINFDMPYDTVPTHQSQLMNEIKAIPEIKVVSAGFFPPAIESGAFSDIHYNDGKVDKKVNVQIRWGDSNYIKVYQIKLLAGRNVLQGDNVNEVLVNDTYAKALGFQQPADIINKELIFSGGKRVPVVGVMQDFHEKSFHGLIGPIVFQARNRGTTFHIVLKAQNAEGTVWQSGIQKIQRAYSAIYPNEEFNYSFFDDSIAKFYSSEQNTSRLMNWATGLSVLISCLGLLGLGIFTATSRTKEIGIRKVLGASVGQIVSILSKEHLRLIMISILIAVPIAWFAVDKWLQDFAYRTTMSWWVFALSGLLLVLVAIITLAGQVLRAAIANPIQSLRNE